MESKKNINISGKKNIYGLLINETETRSNASDVNDVVNDFGNLNYYRKRAACEKWNLPDHYFTHSHQFNIISKLYMNLDNDVIENR